MAEGFVLNISKEMLSRLDAADRKIVQIGESAEKAMKKINEAFGKNLGVEGFIKQLNDIQQQLTKKDLKVNVDLALKNGALDSLKKQIEALGITIPVGVTGTGGGNAGESQSLKNLLNGIVTLTTSVNNLTHKIDGIKVTGSGSTSGGGTSNGEKTDKGIGSYKSKINELLQIEKLIRDIDKAQTELAKKGDKSLSGKSLSVISNLRQQADKLSEELTKIEEKTNKDLSSIQTKWHAKELAEEQKQAKDNIAIQEKEANDLIKIEEREIKEYERLMGKMLKLRKDINANTDLIYSPNPKVSQDALAQITKQEALLKQFEARAKTLEGKYGAGLSEIQIKYSQKELEMLNKAINNPTSNSGIDQKTKDLREYEKVLKRISDLEKVRDRASKAISKYGANSQIGQQANALYQQAERLLQQHNQRRIALEQQYGTELDSIKQAQNAKDLNYLIQQKDAELRVTEQAEKKAIQQYTKLASERNRLLTEQYKTEKIANDPKADSATRQLANQQLQQITAELQRNKQAMLNIEQQYQGKLATIQQRAGQQELQRVRRQNQEEIDEVRRAEQRRQDIQRRWDERRYSRPQGALQYSQNAKTINEKIQAIKYLQNAQKSLDVSSKQGEKQFYELARAIKKTENELRRYGIQLGGVGEQSSHLFNISQQLGRALSLMFSVSQITQYVSKMVNVRKEMELQQRSLQVLLQNKDKANELWNQTLDLAVKSPFRVKELVTYTKQLAAYRIESDKLFETNKMLADVSAGLGVDMQRLILAFGQVKSASFLRGTELRQFTEAGIPMLEELSKYFSEIYGKSVSVAEVFDMISKRMVTFTDVEKVFQRMTGAGGVFFNMQEELSQTTAGMISNLQDSIDLMFNEIGKKNQGIINNVIKAARYLVDNWETVGKVMKGALLILLMYKAATMDISKITKGLGANVKFLFSELKTNPLEFFQAFKGNIAMTALTAFIALVGKVIAEQRKYKQAIEEVNKAHEKFRKSVSDVEVGFAEMFHNGNDNIDEYRDKLQELIGIAKQSYNIEIDFKVNELETIDEVSRKFDDLKEKMLSFNQLSLEFSLDFAERDDRGWEWFQDYIGTDLKDLSASQKDMQSLASSIRGVISGTIKDVSELDKLQEKAESLALTIQALNQSGDTEGANKVREEFDSIIEQITALENKLKGVDIDIVKSLFPQGVDETEYEYIQRITNAISDLQEESKKSGVFNVLGVEMSDRYDFANLNIAGRFAKYTDDLKKAEEELLAFYKSSHSDVANLVNLSLRGQTLGFEPLDLIDAIKEQNVEGIEDLEKIITKELTERGVNPTEELNQILQQIVESNDTSEVNEEFKALVNILNKQSLDEEVSKYVYNGLKNIATQKEFDETTLHKMLKDAENFYKNNQLVNDKGEVILETLDLDLIPKKEEAAPLELQAWQKAYNEEVDKILNTLESSEDKAIFLPLKIRTDLQGVATTKEKQRSVLNESIDSLTKEIEEQKKANAYLQQQYNNGKITLEQYNALYEKNIAQQEKYVKLRTHLRNLLGGDDDKPKKGGGKKNINDQISLIRQLYDEFQKLNEDFGSEKSMRKVVDSFDDAIKQEFGGLFDLEYLEHLVKDKSQVIGVNGGKIFAENYMKNAQNISDLDLKTNLIADSLKTQVDDINTRVLNHIDGLKLNQTQFDVLGKLTLENVSDDELKEFEDSAREFLRRINTNDLDMTGELFHSALYLSRLLENGITSDNLRSEVSIIKHIKEELVKINSLPLDGVKTFQNNITDNFNIIRDNWDYLSNDIKNQLIQLGILGDEIEILPKEDLDAYVQDVKSSVSGILNEIPKLGDFKSPVKDLYNEIMSLKQNTNETNADFANRITQLYEQIQTYAKIELPEIELPEIELPDTINIEDKLTSDNARKLAQTLESIGKIEIITDSQVKDFELELTNALNFIKEKYPEVIKSISEESKDILGVLYNGDKQNNESNAAYVKRLKKTYEDLFTKFDFGNLSNPPSLVSVENPFELPELNIPEITYNYDFSELDEYLNSLQIELPELNLKGEMLGTLATMSSDVSLAEQHVNSLHDALLKLDEENNTNYASRFGENFVKSIKEAETEAERMALLIQTIGLETKDLDSYLESQAIADNLASQFTGVDLSNFSFELSDKAIDFTTLEGIVEALEKLRPKAEKIGKEAVDALEKAIAEAKVEIEVRAKIKKNEEIVQSIEDMFSGYEIGLEFKKLDISPSFVQGLLPEAFEDLNLNTSLDDILNHIQEKRNELEQENLISTDATEEEREGYRKLLKQLDDAEKKVTDMMNQEQMNRLQTYLGLAREAIGERAKIKIEELKKLRDVEDMYAKKEKDGPLTEQDKAQKNSIQEHIRENTKIQMDKLEWEEFQKTDTFINLFRDLENASETMLTSTLQKLQEFKEQWTDMPLEDMKQVIEKINELEMALANLSPRDTIKKSKENLNKYIEENNIEGNYSDAIANLQKENFEFEIENSDLEKLISNLEVYFRLLEEGKQEQANNFYAEYLSEQQPIQGVDDDGNQVNVNLSEQNSLNREQLKLLRNKVQANKDNITNNQELLSDAEKLKNAYLKQAENIGEVQEIVGQLKNGFDSVVEAASVLGADTENIELFGNMANDIISSTLGMVQLQLQLNAAQVSATGFSAAMNTAMGVVGWIVLAVQSIAKVISSIAQAKDNKLVKQIEEQQRKIEKLQKAYDDLAEKIDEAWSVRQLQEYHKELRSTTDDLITAQKAAIEAQEQRKKSSNVGSDEWKELQEMYSSLDDLEKQLEDTEKEIFSKITGGIMDDTLGTAENFVDAWYDAFKETGDGLKGLEDNFNEMLLNLIKRQAAMKIAGRFMDNWNKILDRYASDDDLSNDEIIMYAEKVKGDLPILAGQLEAFYKSFDQILGDTQGNLSGLQRGIQGITEQQADILASYANSCRFLLASIDTNLSQLALRVMSQTGGGENPMVEQLKVIAQQTSAINSVLNTLVRGGHNMGGNGIKVFI